MEGKKQKSKVKFKKKMCEHKNEKANVVFLIPVELIIINKWYRIIGFEDGAKRNLLYDINLSVLLNWHLSPNRLILKYLNATNTFNSRVSFLLRPASWTFFYLLETRPSFIFS